MFNIALTNILHSSPQPKTLIYKKVSKSKKKKTFIRNLPLLRSKKLNMSMYKVPVFLRDYRKSTLDSIITTIATSNRCELDSLEN